MVFLDEEILDYQQQLVVQGEFRKLSRRYHTTFGVYPERDDVLRRTRRYLFWTQVKRWCCLLFLTPILLFCASGVLLLFSPDLVEKVLGVIFGVVGVKVFRPWRKAFLNTPRNWFRPKAESDFWSKRSEQQKNGTRKDVWSFDEKGFLLHRLAEIYEITIEEV